jgi:hypothetical protein
MSAMAKIWVLDTETKGTGANMVPLDTLLKKPASDGNAFRVPRRKGPDEAPAPEPPEPPEPHRFRIVDVMTRQVLADDADARATVAALEDVRSVVDVLVDVWDPEAGQWRRLTLGEQKTLWSFRGAGAADAQASSSIATS